MTRMMRHSDCRPPGPRASGTLTNFKFSGAYWQPNSLSGGGCHCLEIRNLSQESRSP
jgi:hypothetical protein